ncbi:hypothetical protein AMECASPLE_003042 [Ameca splendens]|uniref:Uncharacterized protein n=1 Tax=Ameca splendens TaxID=208324 RepID=A0ABV0XBI3_9TELE
MLISPAVLLGWFFGYILFSFWGLYKKTEQKALVSVDSSPLYQAFTHGYSFTHTLRPAGCSCFQFIWLITGTTACLGALVEPQLKHTGKSNWIPDGEQPSDFGKQK